MPTLLKKEYLTRELLTKILTWAKKHTYFVYFNPNGHDNNFGGFDHFLAVSNHAAINSSKNSFSKLQESIDQSDQYHIGYFSYELKNEITGIANTNKPTIPGPHIVFFIPEILIKFIDNNIQIESDDPQKTWREILEIKTEGLANNTRIHAINCKTSKSRYMENCRNIKKDIYDGEYYEMNYCIEYEIENCRIDPIAKYIQLNETSPMPFSCLGKFDTIYTLCASPERFIKKSNNTLISQPIKGTIRRGMDDAEDQQLKTILRNSQKEIAENMMIVDLVRNDLNKSSQTGTVKVEEFFGIYSFKQVHQMISTISSQARVDVSITEIIHNAFPMGSMTGAPKLRVMQAIDQYEDSQRGIYSGSIGYIKPDGDFDFNVVIRSIIYDDQSNKLSFHVGSAITYDADPEYEYEECLLKAKSMMEILTKE